MQNAVEDAVLTGQADPVLSALVELTASSIRSGRPLFADLMAEPSFYRQYFRAWVADALQARAEIKAAMGKASTAGKP
jgi:hypothetical protein